MYHFRHAKNMDKGESLAFTIRHRNEDLLNGRLILDIFYKASDVQSSVPQPYPFSGAG
jgi:hypothetical protein